MSLVSCPWELLCEPSFSLCEREGARLAASPSIGTGEGERVVTALVSMLAEKMVVEGK